MRKTGKAGSRIEDRGSRIEDRGSRNRGLGIGDPGSTPRMTQTNFASHSKALYARLPSVESQHCLFRVFLSGYGKQQALQLGRM